MLTTPRLARGEQRRPLAHGGVGQQFSRRVDAHRVEGFRGSLIAYREPCHPVHVVAPEIDANGHVVSRCEHIHDRSTDGHLAAVLDLVLPPIAAVSQPPHQLDLINDIAACDRDRLMLCVRVDMLCQRTR